MKKTNAGQMTIEMILICVVLTTVALIATQKMKSGQWASTIVEGPWAPLQGMIESGVWRKSPTAAKAVHPSMRNRHRARIGEPVPNG